MTKSVLKQCFPDDVKAMFRMSKRQDKISLECGAYFGGVCTIDPDGSLWIGDRLATNKELLLFVKAVEVKFFGVNFVDWIRSLEQ